MDFIVVEGYISYWYFRKYITELPLTLENLKTWNSLKFESGAWKTWNDLKFHSYFRV